MKGRKMNRFRKPFSVMLVALVVIALSGMGAGTVLAEEEAGEEGQNKLGLFLGGAHNSEKDGFSVGLDYEYRVNRRFGIGGMVEYSGGDFGEWIAGLPVCWHPWRELKLYVAPGVNYDPSHGDTYFLVRVGADYGFSLGRGFEIAPSLNFETTSEENAMIYGICLSKRF
jgi:hypothetical protein